ncbi:sucrase ferredoxin [Corynebacterium macginleyi]|uniref:sucrase ferredoxin n=1 Tax=Corynebacterium macginleyi TaxID=38290 RepID=UPI00190CAEFF|nr:sucrase ferredoxin [Corynebacterium macginleyi]MBK4180415.1 sucrase ferredoxin [Corynebacterium macginleyi]
MTDFCSDYQVEPLPGTAKKQSVFVLFEWPGGWSRDVLDGNTFGSELTAQLKDKLKGRAGLQLIRRPGRDGRQIGSMHRCYLVWAEQGVMELVLMTGPEKILDLDLSAPGRNGGGTLDTPLVLVCTHGKRDKCCAVKGRPLAAELVEDYPDMVWETSHTKGHRFAPSVMLMPWGYSFGWMNREAAAQMIAAAAEGKYFYPVNRGRGTFGPRGQVAELAVARELIDSCEDLYYGQLHAEDHKQSTVVTHADGRQWSVVLEQRAVEGVVSSCGDAPKTGKAFVATDVELISGA